MLAKMEKFTGIRKPDLSPNDKAVLALTWKYFVWGALGGALLAIVWNKSLDFWTVIGGGVFGVVLTAIVLVLVAFDVIRFPGKGDDKP